jgi:hypothetical protein
MSQPRTVLLASCLLSAVAAAQTTVTPFPYTPAEPHGDRGLYLEPDGGLLATLDALETVRFTDVPLPGPGGVVERVDLELERFRIARPGTRLFVDGELAGGPEALSSTVSTWIGEIAGEPDSDVFLAFSTTGSRGWIARPGDRVELLAVARAAGGWSDTRALLLHASDPGLQDAPSWECGTVPGAPYGTPPTDRLPPLEPRGPGGRGARTSTTPLECGVLLETDYQYFSYWGDLTAATNYVVSLMSAVSSRFYVASDVILTLPVLNLYTTAADPWSEPDSGSGSAGGLLAEFRSAWAGFPATTTANVAHFLSGGIFGGGVAYLDVLCNGSYGFGVSTGITGSTPIPVPTYSGLTWDFVVTAHELGHNFGTGHTHDYCPPIDQCSSSFGACQTSQVCQLGTIMSYCHTCPGGMANIDTVFHPTVAATIQSKAQASCLQPTTCVACACPWPDVQLISPAVVDSYTLGGRTVTLSGCNFSLVDTVTVDGVALASDDFTVVDDSTLTFEMPLLSRTGIVGVQVTNDFGPSFVDLFTVTAPSTPVLGLDYSIEGTTYLTSWFGAPLTAAGTPQDLVYVAFSPDLVPSTLPGLLSASIGNGFASLYVVWTFPMGSQAWSKQTFAVPASLAGQTLHFQAATFTPSTGALPLTTTNVATGTVLF